jgi:metallo-beta-lactamase class B
MENVHALGYDPLDIKLILNTHVHFDHAGGIAAIQQTTRARVAASPASAPVLERGSSGPDDPQYGLLLDFPPVPEVELFTPGDTLRVGSIEVASHATGGHTPGGTSWSWESCDAEGCVDVVYADSQTPISAEGFRFTDNETYPDALADFEHGHRVLEQLPCGLLITTHPSASSLWERLADGPDGIIDSDACRRYAAAARQQLATRVESEMNPVGSRK